MLRTGGLINFIIGREGAVCLSASYMGGILRCREAWVRCLLFAFLGHCWQAVEDLVLPGCVVDEVLAVGIIGFCGDES